MALQGLKRALEDLNIRSLVKQLGFVWAVCDLRVAIVKSGDNYGKSCLFLR